VVENGKLNISNIARKSGINHGDTSNHLEKLKKIGLIKEENINKTRFFEPTFDTLVVRFRRGISTHLDVK